MLSVMLPGARQAAGPRGRTAASRRRRRRPPPAKWREKGRLIDVRVRRDVVASGCAAPNAFELALVIGNQHAIELVVDQPPRSVAISSGRFGGWFLRGISLGVARCALERLGDVVATRGALHAR